MNAVKKIPKRAAMGIRLEKADLGPSFPGFALSGPADKLGEPG